MKKAIATMLSLAIVLSTFLFDIQVNAAALEKPQLVLTQTDVMQGDIFTSTLYFEKYSSVSAASFTFAYNPEYVELISCVPNEDCIVTPVIKSDIIGSISISIASGTNISAKMPLIDVSFKVNDDLAVGKYDLLKLTGTNNYVRRLDNDNVLQTVEFDFITSDLNIYGAGDINLDGKVDGSDAVYMLRYEAGLNSGKSDLPFYLPYYENIDEYNEHQRFILRVADAYYDGTVNGSDAVSVLRHEVGFDEMLGNRTDIIFYDEDGKELIVKNVIINEELKKIPEVPKKDGMKGMWSLSLAEYEEPNFSNVTTKLKVYPYYITDKCDHTMQRTAAKSATCTEDGNIEYWYCEKCNTYFSDEAGNTEITLAETIIKSSGHTYSSVWSYDDTYHWHNATCGHTITSKYAAHTMNENNICTVCGYEGASKEDYKEQYTKYSELGKTVDLIHSDDLKITSGGKNVFSNALYSCPLNVFDEGNQESTTGVFSSLLDYSSDFSAKLDAKVSFGSRKNKNGGFLTNKLPSVDIGLSGNYEKKKGSETSEFLYSYNYVMNGSRVEISEFKDLSKLSSMISPALISDATKVRNGAMSAQEFVNLWGTHVITSGIYGSKVDVSYYEIANNQFDSEAWKAGLQAEFSQRFLKTTLDFSASAEASQITTSVSKENIQKLSIKVKSKKSLASDSLWGFQTQYADWVKTYNSNTDSVFVDVGNSGLCCVWYLLDDSFNDVKIILDEYLESSCSDLYKEYLLKMNGLKLENDFVFDKESGTLKVNLHYYQKAGSLSGFLCDNYVSYDSGVLSITPYYNGNQIKRIDFVGAYGEIDSAGQIIESLIPLNVELLSGNWYDELEITYENVGVYTIYDNMIDFSKLGKTPNIKKVGNNLFDAQTFNGFISTKSELMNVKNNQYGKYILLNDINLNGEEWIPIKTFYGLLDGNGNVIYNFKITGGSSVFSLGFIEKNYGTIRNLTIGKYNTDANKYSVTIDTSNSVGDDTEYDVGILTGVNYGTISFCRVINCFVSNTFQDRDDGKDCIGTVGAITAGNLGLIDHCSVESCELKCLVKLVSNSAEKNYGIIGGIAAGNIDGKGKIQYCLVKDCIIENDVHEDGCDKFWFLDEYGAASSWVGGILGINYGECSVTNCISTGNKISSKVYHDGGVIGDGRSYCGGVVGYASGTGGRFSDLIGLENELISSSANKSAGNKDWIEKAGVICVTEASTTSYVYTDDDSAVMHNSNYTHTVNSIHTSIPIVDNGLINAIKSDNRLTEWIINEKTGEVCIA